VIEPCAISLELLPWVRSGVFLFYFASLRGLSTSDLLYFCPLFYGIVDDGSPLCIVHCWII